MDTVGPEEEGKRIEEIVKKVKEQEANPPKPESVQRVKVVENPQADDGSALNLPFLTAFLSLPPFCLL